MLLKGYTASLTMASKPKTENATEGINLHEV